MKKKEPGGINIETFRATNIGQPLMEVAKDFQRRALAKFYERGHDELQPSHQAVLAYLHASGTRLTELADLAGMSKQAMGQLVDEIERLGYVERVPDPSDGRAKIVRFTVSGKKLIRDGTKIASEIQEQYTALIGVKRFELLREILDELRSKAKALPIGDEIGEE